MAWVGADQATSRERPNAMPVYEFGDYGAPRPTCRRAARADAGRRGRAAAAGVHLRGLQPAGSPAPSGTGGSPRCGWSARVRGRCAGSRPPSRWWARSPGWCSARRCSSWSAGSPRASTLFGHQGLRRRHGARPGAGRGDRAARPRAGGAHRAVRVAPHDHRAARRRAAEQADPQAAVVAARADRGGGRAADHAARACRTGSNSVGGGGVGGGAALLLVGVPVLLPWLVERVAGRMPRRADVLAARDPAAAAGQRHVGARGRRGGGRAGRRDHAADRADDRRERDVGLPGGTSGDGRPASRCPPARRSRRTSSRTCRRVPAVRGLTRGAHRDRATTRTAATRPSATRSRHGLRRDQRPDRHPRLRRRPELGGHQLAATCRTPATSWRSGGTR